MKLIDGRERKKSLFHSKGVLLHGEHMTKREMQHAGKSIAGPPMRARFAFDNFFLKIASSYTELHQVSSPRCASMKYLILNSI